MQRFCRRVATLMEGRMPARTLLISVAVAMAASGIAIAGWNAGGLSQTSSPRLADRRPSAIPVDTELVIAVDVSNSMDPEEQELQREGYIAALTSQEFLSALRGGATGKVAVTYFEWAGLYDQKIILPWRLFDGLESAKAVANNIARAPYRRAPRTSINGATALADSKPSISRHGRMIFWS